MKKIGLLCLCLASLSLAGCFHIPDEDWLPSRNKVNTGDTQKDVQVEQALNSLIDGIDMISSDWNDLKNEGIDEITTEEGEENTIEMKEAINDGEMINNEIENEEIENDILTEE